MITFGADGGYGHPDHIAISELTTEAFGAHARDSKRGQRPYHAVFPPRRTATAQELAHWRDALPNLAARVIGCCSIGAHINLFGEELRVPRWP